ncbi:ArsR/SmtB family transcription factor [Enterococcus pingfangensis]
MPIITHPNIDDVSMEQILYSLSEPTRLAIVSELDKEGEVSCNVFEHLGKKNTLSHHYKTLRENGIIHVRAEGRHRFISLRKNELEKKFPNLIDVVLTNYEDGPDK